MLVFVGKPPHTRFRALCGRQIVDGWANGMKSKKPRLLKASYRALHARVALSPDFVHTLPSRAGKGSPRLEFWWCECLMWDAHPIFPLHLIRPDAHLIPRYNRDIQAKAHEQLPALDRQQEVRPQRRRLRGGRPSLSRQGVEGRAPHHVAEAPGGAPGLLLGLAVWRRGACLPRSLRRGVSACCFQVRAIHGMGWWAEGEKHPAPR